MPERRPRRPTVPGVDRRTALTAPLLLPGFAAMLAAGGCAAPVPPPATDPLPALRHARFVLLGEVHDNPHHHRLRAGLLRRLLADGRPTWVVFEQMERGREAELAAAAREPEAIASAGRLDRAGWRWPMHRPLIEAALAGGAGVRGGNLDRDTVRRLVRDGLDAAPADLAGRLREAPWTAEQEQTVRQAIDLGHCGVLPAAQLAPMALAQRGRDAALAQAMLDGAPARAVLIAGNGHVRNDVGVPAYLRAAGVPAAEIVSVAYLEEGDDGALPADLRQLTPAAERPDPCAAFRASRPAR